MPFISSRALNEIADAINGLRNKVEALQRDTTALREGVHGQQTVIRDGLGRHRDTTVQPLNRINDEHTAIRGHVHQLAGPRSAEESRPAANLAPDEPQDDSLDKLLRAAAGISAAHLHTHRDNWAFLVENAGQDPHFRVPGKVTSEKRGAVKVVASGRSLVAALTSLRAVRQRTDVLPGTRTLARHLYARIEKTVQAVTEEPQTGEGDPVTIVIDDRPKTEEG
ncbi:hypothetical protein [Streptomyces poonensis]|uniref:Uncharacterized protein n=1 Tax=Streptomyces poonensis TaxID=68255 RepID=A0A918UV93_9ACTN|nr:hypothetical protein [Streptomyces poonensis]GGZ38037.1 hypothetical protein GCM10010365_68530 [Streptomyces poonensis]GLJ91087.1 hypothetical protein GCM10017589_36930 [Streptomyces poonensis]